MEREGLCSRVSSWTSPRPGGSATDCRWKLVAVRLTAAQVDKLDALARETQRDRSKMIRLLIGRARLSGETDITEAQEGDHNA